MKTENSDKMQMDIWRNSMMNDWVYKKEQWVDYGLYKTNSKEI